MSEQCALCGKEGVADNYLGRNEAVFENDRSYVCDKCFVRLWPSPIVPIFHFGTPRWAAEAIKNIDFLKLTRHRFSNTAATVHYFPRAETETTPWMTLWSPGEKPREPYSYRGWCRNQTGPDQIIVLVDETETAESIRWITYHELAHAAVTAAPWIDQAMSAENKNQGRTYYEWKDDAGHEADSEEQLVNRVATAYCGGLEYARPWWRERVNAKLAGLPKDEWPNNPRKPDYTPQGAK